MSLHAAISKQWRGFALDVSLQTDGGVLGLLGASGSGKSMTLRSIAGIDTPDHGRVLLGERVLFDDRQRINLSPQRRKVGYLFQNYALFPRMNVAQNIGCAAPREQRSKRVAQQLERLQLDGMAERYPSQLSGGQQQRVALARCLVSEPEALLLDEPFSALDEHLRQQVRLEFLGVLRGYPGPVVLVTHDQAEAYQLCHQLVILENGHVVAQGDTKALFRDPGSAGAARILGVKNILPAERTATGRVRVKDLGLELTLSLPIPEEMTFVGMVAHALKPSKSENDPNRFAIQVLDRINSPRRAYLLIQKKDAESVQPLWCTLDESAREVPQYVWIDPADVLPLTR